MGIISLNEAQVSTSIYNLEPVPYENENFMTEAYTSIIETEQNWNMLQKTIATNELACYAQTGEELVYQEADISGFFSKIKEFFVKIWEKIKKLFAKFMAFIHSFTMDNKSYVKKYRTQISTRFDKLKDFSFKGYKYSIGDNITGRVIVNIMKHPKFVITPSASGDLDFKKTRENLENMNDIYDEFRGLACKAVGNHSGGSVSQGEFAKEINSLLRSGDTAKITLNKSDISTGEIMNEIESADTAKKEAEKDYKESEKIIKRFIKEFDDMEKKVGQNMKGKSGDEYTNLDNELNVYNKYASIGRVTSQIIQTVNGAVMAALKEQLHQNKAICTRILTGAVEKEYKGESTIEHYSEGMGMFSTANFI